MIEVIFLAIIGLVYLFVASIQDIRKREVANWLSFSLIIFALAFKFFYSLFSQDADGFGFFYQGLIGLAIFYILGNLFYFGRVFAGGDAKLMIALGPVLSFTALFSENLKLFGMFFVIFLVCGALYGLFYSLLLSIKHWKRFSREFEMIVKRYKKALLLIFIVGITIIFTRIFFEFMLYVGIIIILAPFLYIYAVSVEKTCLIIEVPAKRLTEGDWLYGDVKVGRKTIKADWDGLNARDIKLLKKHKRYVMIRQGIPFIPVFLIAFLLFIIAYFFELINIIF